MGTQATVRRRTRPLERGSPLVLPGATPCECHVTRGRALANNAAAPRVPRPGRPAVPRALLPLGGPAVVRRLRGRYRAAQGVWAALGWVCVHPGATPVGPHATCLSHQGPRVWWPSCYSWPSVRVVRTPHPRATRASTSLSPESVGDAMHGHTLSYLTHSHTHPPHTVTRSPGTLPHTHTHAHLTCSHTLHTLSRSPGTLSRTHCHMLT